MAGVNWTGNTTTSPRWAGDFGGREHIVAAPARVDASQFLKPDGAVAVVGAAGAAQNATTVPVAALANPIPAGTTLPFGGTKYATTAVAAAKGAVSLTVSPLVTALVSGDSATYPGLATTRKSIPSGTPIGRTFSERDASAPFGPATHTDDEFYLTYFDIPDADQNADVELYRPTSLVKENYLPNFATMTTNIKTRLRAVYQCITGAG